MATKLQLEEQIDDLLEIVANLKIELSQSKEKYSDLLTEFKELSEEHEAQKGNRQYAEYHDELIPVASYKARCAAARAEAMRTGKTVRI